MITISESDLVLGCPCGNIWWEKVDVPMHLQAFIDRVRAAERCPNCGYRARKGEEKAVRLLVGAVRQAAIKEQGWEQSQ